MSTPEEIRYDGQQQDREDKRRESLERRARMGGSDAPEDCEKCKGTGEIVVLRELGAEIPFGQVHPHSHTECPRCLGTGVQP